MTITIKIIKGKQIKTITCKDAVIKIELPLSKKDISNNGLFEFLNIDEVKTK